MHSSYATFIFSFFLAFNTFILHRSLCGVNLYSYFAHFHFHILCQPQISRWNIKAFNFKTIFSFFYFVHNKKTPHKEYSTFGCFFPLLPLNWYQSIHWIDLLNVEQFRVKLTFILISQLKWQISRDKQKTQNGFVRINLNFSHLLMMTNRKSIEFISHQYVETIDKWHRAFE